MTMYRDFELENLSRAELADEVLDLRGTIDLLETRFRKAAAITQTDPDNIESLYAKCRVFMSNIGITEEASVLADARRYFPGFNDMYRRLDEVLVYEYERLMRNASESALDGNAQQKYDMLLRERIRHLESKKKHRLLITRIKKFLKLDQKEDFLD